MRIGISGAHGTGKTTLVEELCERLPGHQAIDEPYVLLEEEGYEFGFPPSPEEYRMQLRRSLRLLRASADQVVFDRTPVDFLGYLTVHGHGIEEVVNPGTLRSAMSRLELLVVVPVTAETERHLPQAEMLRLRRRVNDAILEIVHSDPVEAWGDLAILELTVPLHRRVEAVLSAIGDGNS